MLNGEWLWANGNHWARAASALVLCFTVLGLGLFARRITRRVGRSETAVSSAGWHFGVATVLGHTSTFFLLTLAVCVGLETWELKEPWSRRVSTAFALACWAQAGFWATALLDWVLEPSRQVIQVEQRVAASSVAVAVFIGRILIWASVFAIELDTLGVNVTAVIAGLGVGGIAVALAVQNVLVDVLASLSIAFDRPFVVGDTLVLGDFIGTVEAIGIKSVRLRSIGGEQLIISNAELLKSRIRNFGRMSERRVLFTLVVAPETTTERLAALPALLRACVESESNARFERSHFSRVTETGFEFEVVYHVRGAGYGLYMDAQERVLLASVRACRAENIECVFPLRRLASG